VAAAPWGKIGWRNLGRNKRRTLIAAVGLGVGYFAVVFMVGWSEGLEAEMIENGTGLLMGQIQIHASDYRPDRSIYDTIGGEKGADVGELLRRVDADPEVVAAAPRVYAGGLVSSGDSTSAGTLLGVDPEKEPKVSRILNGIAEGRIPDGGNGANEIALGAEMAKQLGISSGDQVVVVAPGADGSMGNDVFEVTGIFHTGLQEVDASYAILPIATLQRLVAMDPSRVHEVAIATRDPWAAPDVAARLKEALAPLDLAVEVVPWTVLQPEMVDYVKLLDSWYFIVLGIVFVIALFGVANTMLMATYERRREFAVMLALGTAPGEVVLTVMAEALALGVLSLLAGALITLPLLVWWHEAPPDLSFIYGDFTMFGALMRPVLRVEYDIPMSLWTAAALLVTALVAALYPAFHAARVPPADTLSGL
jgi:putative ABC transport system permease protein